MDKKKQQTFCSAFVEGLSLKKQREWLIETFTHKNKKEGEERKRHEEEELREKAIDNFKVRCKAFGWWMATLLTMLFVGLTWLSLHLCDDYPFLQTIIIPLKWVFGIGFASYALFNMLIMWEQHFKRYVRKHANLFEPPLKPIQSKQVRDFWLFMMSETMFWGCWRQIKALWKARDNRRTNGRRGAFLQMNK